MKIFISFVKKEFLHIIRDKTTMLILFALPIIMIILFSYAISSDIKNINVAVLDLSKDNHTTRIIEKIKANKIFSITANSSSITEIENMFLHNDINLAIIFNENFANNMLNNNNASVQLLADGTEANSALLYVTYTQGILTNYLQELNDNGSNSNFNIDVSTKMLYNPQNKSEYNFIPGVMGLMFLLINAMMSSIAIVREKERYTMELLLVSPLKPLQIILAKAVPYFTISTLTLAIILLFAFFILNVPIMGSLVLLITVCFLYIFTSLALGLLISSITSSQLAAMLLSGMVLMLPAMLLSGMMFPIESMPQILQVISYIVPARWFISAIKKVMIQGTDFKYMQTEIYMLLAMATVYIVVALKKFKIRLN